MKIARLGSLGLQSCANRDGDTRSADCRARMFRQFAGKMSVDGCGSLGDPDRTIADEASTSRPRPLHATDDGLQNELCRNFTEDVAD